MNINSKKLDILLADCDVLVVNLFMGVVVPSGATGAVDKALDGRISKEIKARKFTGKLGDILTIQTHGKIPAGEVWVLGLGERNEFNKESVRKAFAVAVNRGKGFGSRMVSILHGAGVGRLKASASAQAMTEGAMLALYHFGKYKKDQQSNVLAELIFAERDAAKVRGAQKGIEMGALTADAVNFARDLVNEPASAVTPSELADAAKKLAGKNVEVKVMGRAEAKKMGMGAFLAVAAGSHQEPKFIHLIYKPTKKTKKKIGIVGKAITFDSGGLNLKGEASGIHEMKMDMSGAAAVLGMFKAIGVLKPKCEVHGFIAATENMPGGGAYRPGDIVWSMSGKSIEIGNTDAEGRVTLADALFYADAQGLDEIIDLATLTGACMVALGTDYAGLLGRPPKLVEKIKKVFAESGELIWQLPLAPEYRELNSSTWGDVRNASVKRYGGAITAALFLEEFVKPNTPWAHIDIAGPAFSDSEKWYIKKEGTGYGVRSLIDYVTRS